MAIYQLSVLNDLRDTYDNGLTLLATITNGEIKKIGAQTNAWVELSFTSNQNETVNTRLSLPIELAGKISQNGRLPIRYKANNAQPIVMIDTYLSHQNIIKSNLAMLGFAFLLLLFCIIVLYYKKHFSKKSSYTFYRTDTNVQYN